MRKVLAGAAELGGASSCCYGCYRLAPWLAFVVGGLLLLAAAYVLDRES